MKLSVGRESGEVKEKWQSVRCNLKRKRADCTCLPGRSGGMKLTVQLRVAARD